MSADSPWQVVVPVKRTEYAKTRLQPPPELSRQVLAEAMALDTLLAAVQAVGAEHVLVVSSDPGVVRGAQSMGMASLPDPGRGLNEAISAGLLARPSQRHAVLLGDLPALRPSELTRALDACARHPVAMVPDHSGTGTALLTGSGTPLRPAFGRDSARRHQEGLGAVALHPSAPGLRRDVDDAHDLDRARALGVGRHTLAALGGPLG
ncbi:MAG: 2-phospho-L-lactate guanylyltransferase [Ornithinimicrobium sp.]